MELQKQVTSLKISKRLKELGMKQESLFYFVNAPSIESPHWHLYPAPQGKWTADTYWSAEHYSAFTVAELGEMLPLTEIHDSLDGNQYGCQFSCAEDFTDLNKGHTEFADTEADCRGKMLIYLLENKLI